MGIVKKKGKKKETAKLFRNVGKRVDSKIKGKGNITSKKKVIRKEVKRAEKNNRKAKKKDQDLHNVLHKHLDSGGSVKDNKAKKILKKIDTNNVVHNRTYNTQLKEINKTRLSNENGELPSILDFGITFKEAVFVTEYVKDFDELKAGYKCKIISRSMKKEEQERIINEVLSNPNVALALKNIVQDQIQRTLITSDRTLSQIAKMAFSDPNELFNEDGTIKDMKDIPYSLRVCISEINHKTLYDSRGRNRQRIGHLTKVKLHDSLKALQVLLKDIRERSNKTQVNKFNQFNIYGPGNMNLEARLKELDTKEMDILMKLMGVGKENEIKEALTIEGPEDAIIEMAKEGLDDDVQLYGMDELKEIEQCNLQE